MFPLRVDSFLQEFLHCNHEHAWAHMPAFSQHVNMLAWMIKAPLTVEWSHTETVLCTCTLQVTCLSQQPTPFPAVYSKSKESVYLLWTRRPSCKAATPLNSSGSFVCQISKNVIKHSQIESSSMYLTGLKTNLAVLISKLPFFSKMQ